MLGWTENGRLSADTRIHSSSKGKRLEKILPFVSELRYKAQSLLTGDEKNKYNTFGVHNLGNLLPFVVVCLPCRLKTAAINKVLMSLILLIVTLESVF